MTISAKIICDSVGPNGVRLTTFVLHYPRFIHSEFMTHRMFSRNASSSRAIPFDKQVKMIEEDCAMPLEFRKNQKGMQAAEALSKENQFDAEVFWHLAKSEAILKAKQLAALGVHKQYVNRLLEPFAHITVVVTATEYSNFFALRHHSMAQPEIAELAKQMWHLYSTTEPKYLCEDEWHLPFVTSEDIDNNLIEEINSDKDPLAIDRVIPDWTKLIKMSVARCARVSYLNHDGTQSSYEQDVALYDRLLGSHPIHASPAEHQAKALPEYLIGLPYPRSSNLRGWLQFRKTLSNENITTFEGPLG